MSTAQPPSPSTNPGNLKSGLRSIAEDAFRAPYYTVQARFWKKLRDARLQSTAGKTKLEDEYIPQIQSMFPDWTRERVEALREHFKCFDLNKDGVIDLEEL